MTGCVTVAPETWIAVACGLKQMFLHERSQIVLALWMKKRTLSVCMLQFWNVCRGKCPYILQTAGVRRNKLGYCAVTNLMSKVVDRWTAYNRHDSQCCHSPCEEAPCPFLLQSLSLAQMGAARNSPAVCLMKKKRPGKVIFIFWIMECCLSIKSGFSHYRIGSRLH